jgi:hypothetical protein
LIAESHKNSRNTTKQQQQGIAFSMPKLTQHTIGSKQQRQNIVRLSPTVPCSTVTLPTHRKVSEEDMHSSRSASSCSFDEESLPPLQKISSMQNFNIDGKDSDILCVSSSSDDVPSIPYQQQANSFRLKRLAQSDCLVDLACESQKQQRLVSPNCVAIAQSSHMASPQQGEEDADSAQFWGHFIDTLGPDHYDDAGDCKTSFVPSCPSPFSLDRLQSNDPYPKPEKRRRIHFSHKQKPLKGFFLTAPTVDDAVDHLSTLRF